MSKKPQSKNRRIAANLSARKEDVWPVFVRRDGGIQWYWLLVKGSYMWLYALKSESYSRAIEGWGIGPDDVRLFSDVKEAQCFLDEHWDEWEQTKHAFCTLMKI